MSDATQPDPQLVAWMYRWRRDNPRQDGGNAPTKVRTIHAWLSAQGFESLAESPYGLRDLVDAYNAAGKPLTVADIPAGQGPASLFLAPFAGELRGVYFKAEDGRVARVMEENRTRHEMRVLWDHLVATLPTVDA
jgi:hypothetical protein